MSISAEDLAKLKERFGTIRGAAIRAYAGARLPELVLTVITSVRDDGTIDEDTVYITAPTVGEGGVRLNAFSPVDGVVNPAVPTEAFNVVGGPLTVRRKEDEPPKWRREKGAQWTTTPSQVGCAEVKIILNHEVDCSTLADNLVRRRDADTKAEIQDEVKPTTLTDYDNGACTWKIETTKTSGLWNLKVGGVVTLLPAKVRPRTTFRPTVGAHQLL